MEDNTRFDLAELSMDMSDYIMWLESYIKRLEDIAREVVLAGDRHLAQRAKEALQMGGVDELGVCNYTLN
jgi:hypothetical protein